MNDELGGKIMTEFVTLRPKLYAYRKLDDNKSPKGTNVCAMIGVKWYGGCSEVCQWPSDEEKLGAIFRDNRGIPK